MKILFKKIYFIVFIFILSCSMNDPVDSDYFSDINKVKGKNSPSIPEIVSITSCGNGISVEFTGSTDPDGDELSYVFYYSFTDPSGFNSEDFYDPLRIAGVSSSDGGTVDFTSSREGEIFLWLTAYDGGRESDHCEVKSTVLPGTECP